MLAADAALAVDGFGRQCDVGALPVLSWSTDLVPVGRLWQGTNALATSLTC